MDKNLKNFIKKNKSGVIRVNSFEFDDFFSAIFEICENEKDIIFLERELKKIITESAGEKKTLLTEAKNIRNEY